MANLILKPGREKSVLHRHPWIFSGAIDRVTGEAGVGETVQVCTQQGKFLAWAAYSPASQIRARIWSWEEGAVIDERFFANRLKHAVERRKDLVREEESNAYRLIHGESDGIPGLVVDRYADWMVVQVLSAGPEHWREVVLSLLRDITGIQNVYERSDVDVRELEGLPLRSGLVHGNLLPDTVQIHEHGLQYQVDIVQGHKTGFYIDQRVNRLRLQAYARNREMLNCFSYTGAFAVNALHAGGKSALSVDSSGEALERGKEHIRLNHLPEDRADWLEGDVFQVLRALRDRGRSFDLIVLDPPKFAPTAAQVERAARGYKDINLLAFKLLRPGGILFTFSCSGGVQADLFQKIVAGAAFDAGVEARVVETMRQSPDHPVALNFPEGAYLKGLVCQV